MKQDKIGRRYLIIGIVLAIISLVSIILVLASTGGSDAAEDVTALVLIANERVPPGMMALDALEQKLITVINAPVIEIPASGFIINGDEEQMEQAFDSLTTILNGAAFVEAVPAGNIVPIGYLSWDAPIEIPSDFVAKGIQVDAVASVAGLVEPGDRVDVIASFVELENDLISGLVETKKSKIILQDILVLDVRGVETENATLEINVPEDVYVVEELDEDEEGEANSNQNQTQGISRRTDFSPVNLVPVLAVNLEDAARIHYMETYADSISLVIRHPKNQILDIEDIIFDESLFENEFPSVEDFEGFGLETGDLENLEGQEIIDIEAFIALLDSLEEALKQAQQEEIITPTPSTE